MSTRPALRFRELLKRKIIPQQWAKTAELQGVRTTSQILLTNFELTVFFFWLIEILCTVMSILISWQKLQFCFFSCQMDASPLCESQRSRVGNHYPQDMPMIKCTYILHACWLTRDKLPHFSIDSFSQQAQQSRNTSRIPHGDLVFVHRFAVNKVPQSSTRVPLDFKHLVV